MSGIFRFRVIKTVRSLVSFLLLSVLLLVSACAEQKQLVSFSGSTMGTTYNVKLVIVDGVDGARFEQLSKGVYSTLDRVDRALSTYQEDSELMRFNRLKVGQTLPLSEQAFEVFQLSIDVLKQTDGYFDPSIGPLVSAWGFGVEGSQVTPTEAQIKDLLAQTGMRSLKLNPNQSSVDKLGEGFIDFSAIAKGYGVDKVHDYLKSEGFNDFLVEVGGEIRVSGWNADVKKWRLGIEEPDLAVRKAYNVAHLHNVAMATSGDYRNFIDGPSGRYSHTIDPKTGYPVVSNLASVSVIAQSCALADALATSLMAMGFEKAKRYTEEQDIAAFFIVRSEEQFSSYSTKSMQAYLHSDS